MKRKLATGEESTIACGPAGNNGPLPHGLHPVTGPYRRHNGPPRTGSTPSPPRQSWRLEARESETVVAFRTSPLRGNLSTIADLVNGVLLPALPFEMSLALCRYHAVCELSHHVQEPFLEPFLDD
ncbi:hypothetical protein M758_1G013100 [Ceratodon purpureus]|nr:hypothetical protein M758_1G013100 [Ceratodon purpureus]